MRQFVVETEQKLDVGGEDIMIRKMSGINFRNLLATAVVVTSALGALGARADTAAYSFDSVGASAVQTDLSLGDTFTVSSPITVTSLGYFNETGAGFLTPHEVG